MQPHEFYEVLPDGRFRFRVDHHTISDFNTCDRYFSFRHMPCDTDGHVWGPKTMSIKVEIGSWWSSVMELFYREMALGELPSEHHMWKFATEMWGEHNLDAFLKSDEKTVEYFNKFGGLDGGRLMALEYYNSFGKQHYTSWQVIGAELGFGWKDEVFLGEDDKVVVYYGGKPDLVIYDRTQKMVMPLDFKTMDNIMGNTSSKYKPHPQTAGYIFSTGHLMDALRLSQVVAGDSQILAANPTKCIIMACARLRPTDKPRKGVRAPRFMPVYPNYSAQEIDEWRMSVIEKCRRLRDAIERGVWTPRESACHLFYHGCMFRRICSTPANTREALLKADFVKLDPWKPYIVDED